MRQRKIVFFLIILTLLFGGSYAYSHEENSIRSTVEQFDFYLQASQYGNVYDMASPDFQARVARQDYVSYMSRVLGVKVTIVQYSRFSTIEIYNDSFAVSQHVIDLRRDKSLFGTLVCQAIIWERASGEWRFSQMFPCKNQEVIYNRLF